MNRVHGPDVDVLVFGAGLAGLWTATTVFLTPTSHRDTWPGSSTTDTTFTRAQPGTPVGSLVACGAPWPSSSTALQASHPTPQSVREPRKSSCSATSHFPYLRVADPPRTARAKQPRIEKGLRYRPPALRRRSHLKQLTCGHPGRATVISGYRAPGWTMPASYAITTSWARSRAPSFISSRLTWVLTVA